MSFVELIMDVAYMGVGSWFNNLQLRRLKMFTSDYRDEFISCGNACNEFGF
jgi:hypothetical protein